MSILLFVPNLIGGSLNFKVWKHFLGSLLKCRFESKQNESFMKEVRIVVIFAGIMTRRGGREICGICEM